MVRYCHEIRSMMISSMLSFGDLSNKPIKSMSKENIDVSTWCCWQLPIVTVCQYIVIYPSTSKRWKWPCIPYVFWVWGVECWSEAQSYWHSQIVDDVWSVSPFSPSCFMIVEFRCIQQMISRSETHFKRYQKEFSIMVQAVVAHSKL